MLRNPYNEEYLARRARLGFIPPKPKAMPQPKAKPLPVIIEAPKVKTRADQIVQEVCQKYSIPMRAIADSGREVSLVAPRKEVAYRLATELHMSYKAISRKIGCEDHSSAYHLVREYARIHDLQPVRRNPPKDELEARNKLILQSLNDGMTTLSITKLTGLSKGRVNIIGRRMGYDFEKNATQRQAKALKEWHDMRKLK